MNHDEFNHFCKALEASTYVLQWGNSHVCNGLTYSDTQLGCF